MSIKLKPKRIGRRADRFELGISCLAFTFTFLGIKGLSVHQGSLTDILAIIFLVLSVPVWMVGLGLIKTE